jgi:hypothetical protein
MFLTDLDSRAAIKGSRDPLGLVPLWGHFGRQVVGNLTTVSVSVRGFTTTLLGYHFVRVVQDLGGDGQATLGTFLKFEQLAAYSRHGVDKSEDFRGTQRVKRFLAEGKTPFLSAQAQDQILSDQKVYGLWGLYSSPARASGLVEREEALLTPAAREFVERNYVASLARDGLKDGRDIGALLRQARPLFDLTGRHKKLAKAIARLMGPKYSVAEREFYERHLVQGGPDNAVGLSQIPLARLMATLPPGGFDGAQLACLAKEAEKRKGDHGELAHRLRRIERLESFLAPTAAAFGFALARRGQTVASVAKEIRTAWGQLGFLTLDTIQELRSEIAEAFGAATAGDRFISIAEALKAGDYDHVLKLLVEQNAFVMHERGGSAWVEVSRGKLEVRLQDEGAELPRRSEVAHLWQHNYFLEPLKVIVHTLRGA